MSTRNHLLDIAWVVPGVFKGSGGHANIFRHVAYLSEFGHRNTIYCHNFEDNFRSDDKLREFICENFVDTKARIFRDWNLQRCDVAIATHWGTAKTVHDFPHCSKKFYFVQDYEPYFHSMGFDYLQAENTYRLGLSCITLGRWLTHLLTERYNADADYFDFAVADAIYHVLPGVTPKRRIAFYAQPDKPRRCFELGVRALEIVKRTLPEIEVVFFGSNATSNLPLSFAHTNLGVVAPPECAELYRSSQVGLILSATNPSLIPVEMMACGCAVVDLDRENNRFDYEAGTISLADSTSDALAQAMIRLLEDENARQAQVYRSLEMVSERSFERSARKIETLLLNGWITGHVSQGESQRLDEFQPLANEAAALSTECVQTFTPTQNNLCEIDICFANLQGIDTNSTINCEIWDAEEELVLLKTEIPAPDVRYGGWHALCVPAQPLSKDRKYRLVLRSSGTNGSSPGVFYTTKGVYARGRFLIGGKRTNGSLKFKTYCAELPDAPRIHAGSVVSVPTTAGNLKRWEEFLSRRGPIPELSPGLPLLPVQNLRQVVTTLTYPKAGILVRSARFLLLAKHYTFWAWFHLRNSGFKVVRQRLLRRLRLIFHIEGSEPIHGS